MYNLRYTSYHNKSTSNEVDYYTLRIEKYNSLVEHITIKGWSNILNLVKTMFPYYLELENKLNMSGIYTDSDVRICVKKDTPDVKIIFITDENTKELTNIKQESIIETLKSNVISENYDIIKNILLREKVFILDRVKIVLIYM